METDEFKFISQETLSQFYAETRERFNKRIEDRKNEIKKLIQRSAKYDSFIRVVPPQLFRENVGYRLSYDCESLNFEYPWNVPLIEEARLFLEQAGFEKSWDSDNTGEWNRLIEYYVHPDHPNFNLILNCDPKRAGTRCVLVPKKKELKEVVTEFERVCPDAHPELFQRDESGELQYVGEPPQLITLEED